MRQLTRDEAIAFAEAGAWKQLTPETRALFQMTQDCLCMPFDDFHEAITVALGRPVYTHEFGLNREGLLCELQGKAPTPSFEEILALIPAEKLVVLHAKSERQSLPDGAETHGKDQPK